MRGLSGAAPIPGMVLVLLCAACAGSDTSIPSARPILENARLQGKARLDFYFKIPRRAPHKARYLSPGTESIEAAAFNAVHTRQIAKTIVNTTAGSSGCTDVSSGTFTCTLSVDLSPATYTFDVTAYDGRNATGHGLSAISDFTYVVAAGRKNAFRMTLGGIPASLQVSLLGNSVFATGSATAGLQFGGVGVSAQQTLQLTAQDAAGYTIVNPGAPSFNLTSSDPSKLSVAGDAQDPSEFYLTPLMETNALPSPLPGTAVTLTATASQSGAESAPVTSPVSVQNDPIVYVANSGGGGVAAYAPWSSSPILSLPLPPSPGQPQVALDRLGYVYVTSSTAGVLYAYPPGSKSTLQAITGLSDPGLGDNLPPLVDARGDIFVAVTGPQIDEFSFNYGTPSRILSSVTSPSGIDTPYGLAVDESGFLYVANKGGIGVSQFYTYPASTTPYFSFNSGMSGAWQLAFDVSGNLYVVNSSGKNVTEYAPPFSASSSPAATFGSSATLSQPYNVAVDASGNVYVADYGNQDVVEYAPSAPATAVRTFSLAANYTTYVAVDELGYVYVPWSNASAGPVSVYPPGTSTAQAYAISEGVASPYSIAIWP